MLYIWQMNNGRWQVDALTGALEYERRLAASAPSFDTYKEARAWRDYQVQRELKETENAHRS